MTNYVKRFIYIDANSQIKINPLVWPFFAAVIIYGLGFLLGGVWSGVNSSSLFQGMHAIHTWLPAIWGAVAAAAGTFALTCIALRKPTLAYIAAMCGLLVWLFAAWVYILGGYWLVLITVTGPNLYFWVFYYMRSKWWVRQKNAGLLVDAG